MREIVLDTETTGLNPAEHRIVEIGCIELINLVPTDNRLHRYINPECAMSEEAFRVHGLSEAHLAQFPPFADHAADIVAFLGDARLVIHNADFDMGFLNAELARAGHAPLPASRAFDTVKLARRKYPGSPASLDALCKRFAVDLSARTLHGALLDAELLAECYLELMGGRQPGLGLAGETAVLAVAEAIAARPVRPARPHAASAEELAAHAAMLARIKNPLWGTA